MEYNKPLDIFIILQRNAVEPAYPFKGHWQLLLPVQKIAYKAAYSTRTVSFIV